MNVSIVIPNYNGKKLLQKNLPAVLRAAAHAQVIVVDDGSTDDSAVFVAKEFPGIELIKKPDNSGFAQTVNTGVKMVSGDIVVLLNTDIEPYQDFLKPLLSHFDNKNVFAVGCMDESVEGTTVVKRGRGVGTFKRGFLMHSRGEIDSNTTLWVNGGSGAFRKSIWDQLGGMDELYSPFYWEDIDISYRAQKMGYQVLFEPKSVVIHTHGAGAIKKNYTPFSVKKISYRNQFLFVWKNITDISYSVEHFLWLPYYMLKAIVMRDGAFFTGLISALIQVPHVLIKRYSFKKFWKRSDAEILAQFKAK